MCTTLPDGPRRPGQQRLQKPPPTQQGRWTKLYSLASGLPPPAHGWNHPGAVAASPGETRDRHCTFCADLAERSSVSSAKCSTVAG